MRWPFWALLRWVNSGKPDWWIAFGAVAGIGLLNKWTFGLFGAALVVALALTPHRRVFRESRFLLAGALAIALVLPHVLWQAHHEWPMAEFSRNARAYKMAGFSPLEFLTSQILIMGPVTLPLWLAGLAYLLASKAMERYRFLAYLFLALLAAHLLSGGKSYYLAPAYTVLFAAGAILIERTPRTAPWKIILRTAAPVVVMAGGLIVAPIAFPVLSPEGYARYAAAIGIEPPRDEKQELGTLPQIFADRFGWENQVAAVARVFRGLPPEEQMQAVIFTRNYGEAGAIDFWGPRYGLPRAISTHNSYWLWGPRGATGETVIVLGATRDKLEGLFASVVEGARHIAVRDAGGNRSSRLRLPRIENCRGRILGGEQALHLSSKLPAEFFSSAPPTGRDGKGPCDS
ncbi:MAG: glycosyltransferase family 39 protein [Deltaproteobacteria bacterium]|nr:glycosyltransferase family 39 protein [Deltaproteobacteria bacterium]